MSVADESAFGASSGASVSQAPPTQAGNPAVRGEEAEPVSGSYVLHRNMEALKH